MKTTLTPIDYDVFDYEGKNYVQLIGRTETGARISVIDSYEPFFWVILTDDAKAAAVTKLKTTIATITIEKSTRASRVVKVEDTTKHFLGKEVRALKVFVTNHKDLHAVAQEIGDSPIIAARRGYDVPVLTNYIMQGGLEPLTSYTIEGEALAGDDFGGIASALRVDVCLLLTQAVQIDSTKKKLYTPRILAFDIESTIGEIGSGPIYMIGVYGDNYKRVFTWKEKEMQESYVEHCNTEAAMITAFVAAVKEYDPDIICGYFSDGYDMPFLFERAKKQKIPLDLSLDGSSVSFSRGVVPTAKLSGIVHIDVYRFIANVFSQYLAAESLSLSDVAHELIGMEKDDFDFTKLSHMTSDDWAAFIRYNLRDVEITYNLFMKVWPDLFEFTQIIKEPLFMLSRDTMATNVENFVLHNLARFDEIPEKNPIGEEIGRRRSLGKYEGAFVYEPTPGLYENVVMFDFTSMYGSVIVSYNLSRSTFLGGEEVESYTYSHERGFFPILLEEIITLRKKYKKLHATEKDNMSRARSNAYKLLSNAAYGYLAFFGARYYSREAASSTAYLARQNILATIELIKTAGFEILYSDTDSIAFLRGSSSKKDVLAFLERLNDTLPGIMELDLEDFYTRALFVSKRGDTSGAKKKYALMSDSGVMKVRGFETVRRDWCRLARTLQREVLEAVLIGDIDKAETHLRTTITALKERTVSPEDLLLRTQLKKPLSEYVAEGPHVAAARKMHKAGVKITSGMLISYYIGEGTTKSKRIGDRVLLPHESGSYDIGYYVTNQVLPAVSGIFDVLGVDVSSIIDGQTQKGLFDFG